MPNDYVSVGNVLTALPIPEHLTASVSVLSKAVGQSRDLPDPRGANGPDFCDVMSFRCQWPDLLDVRQCLGGVGVLVGGVWLV